MRNVIRKIVTALVVLNLLLPWVFVTTVCASPGQFDMDIIFVLDNSGSMRYADRHPTSPAGVLSGPGSIARQAFLAATAANLFIDMAAGFDTRIGYVMYTDSITGSRGLSEIISPATRQAVQQSIHRMMYGGFTDIALAINHALDLFEAEADRSRTPAIILLSDGDVHFPGEPATAAARPRRDAGRAAAVDAAHRAASMNIPIHVVGFDFADPHTGEVDPEDEQLLRQIAAAANGSFVFAPEAVDLPGVMRDIFAELTDAAVTAHSVPVTGAEQEFTINIPHNSIIQASITAMTSLPLEFVYLYNPAGVRLLAHEYERAEDLNTPPLYTKFTMRNPTMGDYILRFMGTAGDTISIDLLQIYDMELVQNTPDTSEPLEATFSWRLVTSAGAPIDDPTFIATLAPTIHITNVATGATSTETFPLGQTTMTVSLPEGDYSAYLSLDDGRVSNTETFRVLDVGFDDCEVIAGFHNISVTMWTIIPFLNNRNIPLGDVIISPPENWPRTASAAMGDWSDHVEFEFNPAGGGEESITLLARSSGSADDLMVTVTNVHGGSVSFLIVVTVRSGFIIIGGLIALLLLIVLLILMLGKSKKPFMNDPISKLHIKMSVPISHVAEPPPEYMLSMPRIKGRKTLRELINMNVGIAEAYRQAFERIGWFADQTIVSAKTRQLLEIKIPQNPAYQIKVDNMARSVVVFDKNGGTEIKIGFDDSVSGYNEYVIELGNAGLQQDITHSGGFGDDSFGMPPGPGLAGGPPPRDDFW